MVRTRGALGIEARAQPMEGRDDPDRDRATPVRPADERVKKRRRLNPDHAPSRARARSPGLLLVTIFFLATADRSMFTLAGADDHPCARLAARHPGHRRGAPDDRRRVRPFDRLDGGVCRPDLRRPRAPCLICRCSSRSSSTFVGRPPPSARINGQIVIRTRLPSFIVTLAFLFILRGLTLVGLKWATGGSTQLRGISEAGGRRARARDVLRRRLPRALLAGSPTPTSSTSSRTACPRSTGVPVSILWFLVLAAVATWVLLRTRVGNWIFAAGGDRQCGAQFRRSGATGSRPACSC